MHQTLYIDIDEEITSIVERLKKSQANEIIMVVPKRAMLIQSIVNLRLLKKEADQLGLQLMVVTQDKLGKLLVEKAGILVQPKMEDLLEDEYETSQTMPGDTEWNNTDIPQEIKTVSDQNRLDHIGSPSYFDENYGRQKMTKRSPVEMSSGNPVKEAEGIINKELIKGVGDIKKKPMMDYPVRLGTIDAISIPERKNADLEKKEAAVLSRSPGPWRGNPETNQFSGPGDKLENFFHHIPKEPFGKPFEAEKRRSIFNKRILAVASAIITLSVFVVGAFYYVPQATINLTLKERMKEQDLTIKGSTEQAVLDLEKETIPVKLINVEDEISQNFDTSGEKTVSNQKAHGTVVIFNEFSSSPQPLVATTRFVSEDGKLFRLTKGVTVPGTAKDGSDTKPGTVEAEVTADQAGEEYNIGPSKFVIPGFENNKEKYAKIYAKSSQSMTGGGSGGDQQKSRAITDGDFNAAKVKIQKSLNDSVKKKIKDMSGSGMTLTDDAINIEEATYKTSNSVGDVAENFQLTAKTKASALVFKEQDLKDVINNIMTKSSGINIKFESDDITLEYGKILPDFRSGSLDIKVRAKGKAGTNLDEEKFKKDILGKTTEEFESYLGSYPDISKAEVIYWPPFADSKIPVYEKRVEIVTVSAPE